MTRIAFGLLGTLFIAIGLAWAIGPVRLLAAFIAVPVTWAIISVAALTVWVTIVGDEIGNKNGLCVVERKAGE